MRIVYRTVFGLVFLTSQMIGASPTASTGTGLRIAHVNSPSPEDIQNGRDVYICDPAIAIMPDGSYLISHAVFGEGVQAGDTYTDIYRSTDKGASWVRTATMRPLWRANLFTHEGVVYCIGTGRARNDVGSTLSHLIIYKSLDNGVTWTDGPAEKTDIGYLRTGNTATPSMMVKHEGRIWMAHNLWAFSGDLSADLMKASSWALNNHHDVNLGGQTPAWPDTVYPFFRVWSEGQIVASPKTGVVLLPKIEITSLPAGSSAVPHFSHVPHTALINVNAAGSSPSYDPGKAFVTLPGTKKKFGVTYDPATQKFYALTNTVLPKYRKHEDPHYIGSYRPNLTRNTGTLYSSEDLVHWNLEKIFIHSDNVDHDAWQYFQFAFDGDDMIIASRTALRTEADDYDPPRGHDSNLLTFHRISGYAALTPVHILRLENGLIQRYERTDYQDAPLGNFILGTQPDRPIGITEENDIVYVQQQDGRVLSYDSHGNFIGEEASISSERVFSPFPFSFAQNKTSRRTWTYPQSGEWYDPRNWHYWNRPETEVEVAFFGSAITEDATIVLNQTHRLNGFSFCSPHSYTISRGSILSYNATVVYERGGIILDGEGVPLITNCQGHHRIEVPITNEKGCGINLTEGSSLELASSFTQNANIRIHIDLGHKAPGNPVLTLQHIERSNANATLTFVVERIPLLSDASLLLAWIGNIGSIPPTAISIVSPTGMELPHEISEEGFISLLLSYPNPELLSQDELLAYAFTEDFITDTIGRLDHLPLVESPADAAPSISFAPRNPLLLYEVQQSSDLATWTTIASIPGGSPRQVTIGAEMGRTSGDGVFLRIKIVINPETGN